MSRAMGLDLGLKITGFTILNDGPILIGRGVIRPPPDLEAQDAADIITDQVVSLVRRYQPDRVFIEKPILNAWGERDGKRVNMTSAQTGLSKGRLIGAVETTLRRMGQRYDEIGIQRWRAILGIDAEGKDAIIAELVVWLQRRGIVFERGVKQDEIESCGVAAAGLRALHDPKMLEPGWKRPRRKVFKVKTLQKAQEGLFDDQ